MKWSWGYYPTEITSKFELFDRQETMSLQSDKEKELLHYGLQDQQTLKIIIVMEW